MPQSDGFEVLRTLDRAGDRVASVVLTGSESQNDYVQVVRLGARGLVLKGDEPQTLFARNPCGCGGRAGVLRRRCSQRAERDGVGYQA